MLICIGNLIIFGPDNGLLPGCTKPLSGLMLELLLIGPLGTNFADRNSNIFFQKSAFEIIVCGMAAILSRHQCVKCTSYCERHRSYVISWHVADFHKKCLCTFSFITLTSIF